MLKTAPPPSAWLPTSRIRSRRKLPWLKIAPPMSISFDVPPPVASAPVIVMSLIDAVTLAAIENTRSSPPPSMIVRLAPAPRILSDALMSRSPLPASSWPAAPASGEGGIRSR